MSSAYQAMPAPLGDPKKESSVLRARFEAVAYRAAGEMSIEPGCAQYLRDFIQGGVENMAKNELLFDKEKIEEAELGLAKFVHAMKNEAVRLGYNELHEPSFGNVRLRICPLFPFC